MTERESPEGEQVDKMFGCPGCGNHQLDSLSIVNEDVEECGACGRIYHVLSGQVIAQPPGAYSHD